MRAQKTRAPHTSAFCTMANTPASSTSRSRRNPDSARVSACWFRRLAETIFQRSPRLRDAIANTRDACATRKNAPNQIGPKCVPRERRFQASSYATYLIGRGDCRVAHLNQRGIIDPAYNSLVRTGEMGGPLWSELRRRNVLPPMAQHLRHPDEFIEEFCRPSDKTFIEELSIFPKDFADISKIHVIENRNETELAHDRQ